MTESITLETLDRAAAASLSQRLLEMTADQEWDTWTPEHLMADRPQKWARSLLARSGEEVIGWAVVSLREGTLHLHHLAVSPKWRGRGVGTLIIRNLLERVGEEGSLTGKVHKDNTRALSFYIREGFVHDGDSNGDYLPLRGKGVASSDIRVAVHQPNYLPWGGYFAKLMSSHRFVFLDDAQMPQGRSYVSRTKVARGLSGEQWLTVPVTRHNRPRISHTLIADPDWWTAHHRTLRQEYADAPFKDEILSLVGEVGAQSFVSVAELNTALIVAISKYLGWGGQFINASTLPSEKKSDERIAELVRHVGGRTYISGAGGEKYQSRHVYHEQGVSLLVREYAAVPYSRGRKEFIANLSAIDALMYLGTDAVHAFTYGDEAYAKGPMSSEVDGLPVGARSTAKEAAAMEVSR